METVNIFNRYNVYIGSGILKNISSIIDLKNFSKVVVIVDENVPKSYLQEFEKIVVPSGEHSKNIETVKTIWEKMLELDCDRKSLVINLGGGVIGDMGGFAASCYMRGIKFLQISTTLLSAVDASVGGKLGIDFKGVKNLIGLFNQPVGVIVDVNIFGSLPDREFISGFGEIIKHGVIADSDYLDKVTSKKPREFSKDELVEIVKRSCEIKAKIIAGDEKEAGDRKLLNFGHTVGHALEGCSLENNNRLLHGEAVSIGMVAEAEISKELGLIDENTVSRIKKVLENAGLPVAYSGYDQNKFFKLLYKDKKAEAGKINWTLMKGFGQAAINQEVSDDLIKKSLVFISQ